MTETVPINQYAWVRALLPRIVIGALIAAAIVGVYSVIVGDFGPFSQHLLGTIALFVFFSFASWYDADVSARRAPWFGAVSVITSAYLLFAGLVKIWVPTAPHTGTSLWGTWGFGAWIALVVVTRVGLLHIHLVLNTQRRFTGPIMSKVTVATLILVGLLTAGLSLPLLFLDATFSETYWRSVGVIAILDVLGTILIPLTYTLFGPKEVHAPTAAPAVVLPQLPVTSAPVQADPFPAAPQVAHTAAFSAASAYPKLAFDGGLRLEWPRYISGQPLPANADGAPDFTGVIGYSGR
jgi:hypothetical protein